MNPAKVILVTAMAGGISIGAAIFGQRWVDDAPLDEQSLSESITGSDGIRTLPDFRLNNLDGRELTSNTWAGKVVVLNYWASWCPPCVRELPLLNDIQARFGPSGVQVVGIALDHLDDARAFVAEHPIDYPILIGNAEIVALSKGLGNRIEGLPFTVVFDNRGRRVFSQIGELEPGELDAQLMRITGIAEASKDL